MSNKAIEDYIKKQLKAGYSKKDIKKALLDAGWKEEDIIKTFNHLNQNSHNGKSGLNNKKAVVVGVVALFILTTLAFGGFHILNGDSDVSEKDELVQQEESKEDDTEEKNETEGEEDNESKDKEDEEDKEDEDGKDELALGDADQCQPGEFEVEIELEEDEMTIPLSGNVNFHGVEGGYCGISYSFDVTDEERDEFEQSIKEEFSVDDIEELLSPHYIGEENFCFMAEEDFGDFHEEINDGTIEGNHFLKCIQTSLQKENQFNELRDVINNYVDGNYHDEFEWDITSEMFMGLNTTEKITLMGSSKDDLCFYKSTFSNSEPEEDISEEESMELESLGSDPAYCITPCKSLIDDLLATRNPKELDSRTLDNPKGLDYSETVEKEEGEYKTLTYVTQKKNGIPCVYASEELIEKDPNIESEEEIFEALSNHETLGDN